MGLNVGILAGMGDRYRQKRTEDEEKSRYDSEQNSNLLKSAAEFWEKRASDEANSPEAMQHSMAMSLLARMSDPSKKPPKELWDATPIIKGVRPQVGGSWMGGQTSRSIETKSAPIGSELSPSMPASMISGQMDDGSGVALPNYDAPQMHTPPAQQFAAPIPPIPDEARVPFRIPEETRINRAFDLERRKAAAAKEGNRIQVPGSMQSKLGIGEFEDPSIITASSNIYRDEVNDKANADAKESQLAQQAELQKERLAQQAQLAGEAEAGRNERAQAYNELRAWTAQMSNDTRTMLAEFALGNRPIPAAISKDISENADTFKLLTGIAGMLEDPATVKELGAITGLGGTTMADIRGRVNALSPAQQNYITNVGLVRTLVSHPLFGSAFTATELSQMRSFMPELVHYPEQALNRVNALKGWIANRVFNRIQREQVPATRQKVMQQAAESGFPPEVLAQYGANSAYSTLSGAEKAAAGQIPIPDKEPASSGGTPGVGDVEDGYRFKGGDPADQNNWEAVTAAEPSASNSQSGNLPTRNNNPLNIKLGGATQQWVDQGLASVAESAQDGGRFLKFESPEVGFIAAKTLLGSPVYANLTVDEAMKKWSNSGYSGRDIAPEYSALRVSQLSPDGLDSIVKRMARREGYAGSATGN